MRAPYVVKRVKHPTRERHAWDRATPHAQTLLHLRSDGVFNLNIVGPQYYVNFRDTAQCLGLPVHYTVPTTSVTVTLLQYCRLSPALCPRPAFFDHGPHVWTAQYSAIPPCLTPRVLHVSPRVLPAVHRVTQTADIYSTGSKLCLEPSCHNRFEAQVNPIR